jgi:glycosyltransferase involved in cell wall biosynthesis
VSLSEGVPVSIMEAFSAGIPVYATNVGGTSEIVDNSNGKLLDVNISPEQLAEEIRSFQRFPDEIKLQFRKNALQTYFKKCSFDKLNEEFISFLNS